MEEKKRIGELIIDYLSDERDEKEIDPFLTEWLAETESNQKDLVRYKKIWKSSCFYQQQEVFDTQSAWYKIDRINQKRNKTRKRLSNISYLILGVAASLLILFALSVKGAFDRRPEIPIRMTADYGSRSEVTLPDGTIVNLNAGSEITYVYNKREKIREVHFQGEAFFNVSKNENPFVVKMVDGLQLRVYGTSFNLQAYVDEEIIEASLVEGCIELDHGDNKLLMRAGDMAVFDKQTEEIKQVSGVLSHSYSWLDDKLYMDHMSLSSVCKYLERRYDVVIKLQGDLGEKMHYDGVIQEETVMDILGVLSRLSDIKYSVKGKNISINSK